MKHFVESVDILQEFQNIKKHNIVQNIVYQLN